MAKTLNTFNTKHVSVIYSTFLSPWDVPENWNLAAKPCFLFHFSLQFQQIATEQICGCCKFSVEVNGTTPIPSNCNSGPSFSLCLEIEVQHTANFSFWICKGLKSLLQETIISSIHPVICSFRNQMTFLLHIIQAFVLSHISG